MGSSLERGSRFKVLGSKVQGFRVQRFRVLRLRIWDFGFGIEKT